MSTEVLMIGTDILGKGGIASVIDMYRQGGLLDRVTYQVSHNDKTRLNKLTQYLTFLPCYIGHLLKHRETRIVHIHTASYASFIRKSLVLLIARAMGRKTILHVHGAEFNKFFQKQNTLGRTLMRFVLRQANCIIALSQHWKTDLYHISGNPNIRVIYNPTVMREPVSSNGRETVQFLFMGRLGQRKGVYDLIESVKNLTQKNVHLKLYGDGEVEEIQSLIEKYNIGDQVEVCGWISGPQKDEAFRTANVLILPSYNEGLPISVLEAMAYGMPVLATPVGGIPDAVEDGHNGFLVKPGDQTQMVKCIEKLAASSDLRARMGQAGYERAQNLFSLPVIIQQLEQLYVELLDEPCH